MCTVLVAAFLLRGQTEGERPLLLPENSNPVVCISNVRPLTANSLNPGVNSNTECGTAVSNPSKPPRPEAASRQVLLTFLPLTGYGH